jgi:hypothetical protein
MRFSRASIAGAAFAAFFSATPVVAETEFDGRWSVRVVASTDECDDNFSISLNIDDGAVSYGGLFGAVATGNVTDSGLLTARVSSGADVVNASGELENARGSGKWVSPNCKGFWTARKA